MNEPNRSQPITAWVLDSMEVQNWCTITTGIDKEDGKPLFFAVFKGEIPPWDRVGMLEGALIQARSDLVKVMRDSKSA